MNPLYSLIAYGRVISIVVLDFLSNRFALSSGIAPAYVEIVCTNLLSCQRRTVILSLEVTNDVHPLCKYLPSSK